jgi:serine/threonine-protein kinase HipA
MRLAEALGLETPNSVIGRFEEVAVLVVERFDRQWSQDRYWLLRIPQEDMCMALGLPPAKKYESDGGPGIVEIMRLLLGGNHPLVDRTTFMRACIVYWLLAAIDGHARNSSIQLHPGGRFRLCPVYDIVSVYPLLAARQLERQKIKMAMAVHGMNRHYRWSEMVCRH